MSETKHKRCRYCGKRAGVFKVDAATLDYCIRCDNCGARTRHVETITEAWALWDAPRPKRKKKADVRLGTVEMTTETLQQLILLADDIAKAQKARPASEPSGGLPRRAITDLLAACLNGAWSLRDDAGIEAGSLQDLLNLCIANNTGVGGHAGKAHYYAQISAVDEGVYK